VSPIQTIYCSRFRDSSGFAELTTPSAPV